MINVTESGIVASKEVLPSVGGDMTQGSILEYTEAVRGVCRWPSFVSDLWYKAAKTEMTM